MNTKNTIFFAEIGLTSTSANTIANLAKEYIQEKQSFLDNIRFYTTKVGLIGSNEQNTIQYGNDNRDIKLIPSILQEIATAKSLIAWLREAIKARQALTYSLDNLSIEDYCEMVGKEMPVAPKMGKVLTEDEYYGSLSLKERNRYYQLETQVAVIGKYIHPDGVYAEARADMQKKQKAPHSVNGSGRDTLIYTYYPTASVEDVEQCFFKLQQMHRELQKQLNSIKFECEKAIAESQSKVNAEYVTARNKHNSELELLYAEFRKYIHEQSVLLGQLKIVIPDSLKSIYDKVSSLGK